MKKTAADTLGTAHLVITRDIDEGWVNVGCYRVMVHDRDTLALYISPGKQGRIIRQKYFDQGQPLPRRDQLRRRSAAAD